MPLRRFARVTLGWTVFVVLGGALVRSTGSGAGCGRSWPTCQGSVLPELRGATAIEFGHRAVSGVALILVAALIWRIFRAYGKGEPARRGAFWSGVLIIVESLVGAVIVFYEWVADDASVARAISVPIHLVNTFLLLAVLTMTVYWVSGGGPFVDRTHRRVLIGFAGGMLLIAATGGVTALADTLFPRDGFTVGGIISLETGEHFLTELRIIHPIVSIVVGVAMVWWTRRHTPGTAAALAGRIVMATVAAQMVLGTLNVVLGTPTWMSIIHLLAADVLWIAWVWAAAQLSQAMSPALSAA
ncbi:MAG: heme A synthase [Acidimicrobiia bacterium]